MKKSVITLIIAISAVPANLLSWNYFTFKIYHWYKPHTGEVLSEILPNLYFWEIFAFSMIMKLFTGVINQESNTQRILGRLEEKKGDPLKQIFKGLVTPWVVLFFGYILYTIIY